MGKVYNFFNTCNDALSGLVPDRPDVTLAQARAAIKNYIDWHLTNTPFNYFLLNVNYSTSMIPCTSMDTVWQRQTGEKISRSELEKSGHFKNGRYILLNERGIEPFQIAAEFIRSHGKQVWFSFRMNDYHDLKYPLATRSFWLEHPEYRLGDNKAFDFAHREVRDEMKRYIFELCSSYDIDGIELDFMRGCFYFPLPASQENIDFMRSYVKEIREGINKIAREKGKTLGCVARIPSDLNSALFCGLDGAGFIEDNSIDALILTNFFSPSDFNIDFSPYITALQKKGVARENYHLIAGCDFAVSCSGSLISPRGNVITMRQNSETLKGFAANAFYNGADGIYLFNSFSMRADTSFCDIGDRELCKKGLRRHILTAKDPGETPLFPQTLMPQKEDYLSVAKFTLLTAAAPKSGYYKIKLGSNSKTGFPIKVNGFSAELCESRACPEFKNEPCLCENLNRVAPYLHTYDVPLQAVKSGENTISICNTDEANALTLLWLEAEIFENEQQL